MPARFFKSRLKTGLGLNLPATRMVGFSSTRLLRGFQFRPGDMQQLFANIANVANTFAQIIAGRSRKLGANLLHIADDRRPQSPDAVLSSRRRILPANSSSWNQRQMGAEDSFAFAVTLTQLLVQLLGKRCRGCAPAGWNLAHWRGLPDNLSRLSLCNRVSVPTPTPLASTLPYSKSGLRRFNERGSGCAVSSCLRRLDAVAVDKARTGCTLPARAAPALHRCR